MEIAQELKDNLIADVENICELNLKKETKIALERCFEITIGTKIKNLDLGCDSNNEVSVCPNCKKQGGITITKHCDKCNSTFIP